MTAKKNAEKWIENLLAVLNALDGMAIDDRIRITMRRACTEAIVNAEDAIEFEYEHRNSGSKWSAADLAVLEATLNEAGPCLGWSEEQMRLDQLMRKLGRPKKIIKAKAIELGFGGKVDYWINKDLPGAEQ